MSTTVRLGAGCSARLRWPSRTRVEISVYGPDRRIRRQVRGAWNASALRLADTEVRHIADAALRSGRAPSLHGGQDGQG